MNSIEALWREEIIINIDTYKPYVKDLLKNLQWGFYGKILRNPPPPVTPKYLLFICKGNICRSPFAERLAGKMVLDKGIEGVSVDSAGFEAVNSNSSPTEAVRSALRFGISIGNHSAKALDGSMMKRADMVLVMEVAHKRRLSKAFPIDKDKIYLLPLFNNFSSGWTNKYIRFNIPDPYGQAEDKFTDCYFQIDHCLNGLFSSIYE